MITPTLYIEGLAPCTVQKVVNVNKQKARARVGREWKAMITPALTEDLAPEPCLNKYSTSTQRISLSSASRVSLRCL